MSNEEQPGIDGEETITLTVRAFNLLLQQARKAGKAAFRNSRDKRVPEPFTELELSVIDTLLKQGHTPNTVFRAFETGLNVSGNFQKLDGAGCFIRRTLFHRPMLKNSRRDRFTIDQLADIKTLLEIGIWTTEQIAERYKKSSSNLNTGAYFMSKLRRTGYIVGFLLERKP